LQVCLQLNSYTVQAYIMQALKVKLVLTSMLLCSVETATSKSTANGKQRLTSIRNTGTFWLVGDYIK